MTATIHERSAIQRELEIKVDEAELQEAFDEAYKTMRSRLSLPGFRPGKAPMGMIKKMHGDAIEGDALERLAQEKFREAAEEHKIEPLGTPVMTDLHRHPGEGAHFKIMYEIPPTIELQDMSGVEIEQHPVTVTEEDIDRTVERLRFRRAERIPVAIVADEQTVARLSFLPPGRPESEASEQEIYLADPEILPEVKDAVVGKSVGETLTLDLPAPHDHSEEPHEHTTQPIEVTIVAAERVELPELTEELIQEFSGKRASTLPELREDVRTELKAAREKAGQEDLEERIVAKMLEMHSFEVPQAIVQAILDQMLEERQQQNVQRGFPANYGLEDEQFRQQFEPIALSRGKWVILRDKIIEANNIEATDEDLDKLAEEEAAKYGLPKENLLKYYHKHDTVKNRIVGDKLGAALRSMVKIVTNDK